MILTFYLDFLLYSVFHISLFFSHAKEGGKKQESGHFCLHFLSLIEFLSSFLFSSYLATFIIQFLSSSSPLLSYFPRFFPFRFQLLLLSSSSPLPLLYSLTFLVSFPFVSGYFYHLVLLQFLSFIHLLPTPRYLPMLCRTAEKYQYVYVFTFSWSLLFLFFLHVIKRKEEH